MPATTRYPNESISLEIRPNFLLHDLYASPLCTEAAWLTTAAVLKSTGQVSGRWMSFSILLSIEGLSAVKEEDSIAPECLSQTQSVLQSNLAASPSEGWHEKKSLWN